VGGLRIEPMSRGVGCELGRRKLLGSGETWISDFCCDKGCYAAQCKITALITLEIRTPNRS
jgi:hypothetical protein